MLHRFLNSPFRPAVLLAIFFLFTQCGKHRVENDLNEPFEDTDIVRLTEAQFKYVSIQTTFLTEKSIATKLKLNGKIDVPPQNLISITNPLGGYLKSTTLLPGQQVKKGMPIAVMEDPQYIELQRDYLITKERFQVAKLDYERQRDLNANQASSDKVLQQAEAEMHNQHISMQALAQQLHLLNINPSSLTHATISRSIQLYSPIDGFVSQVHVNVGKYVTPSDVLFELIDPTDIHLNLKVYEKDLNKIAIGQRVTSFTNNTGERHEGHIILISQDVNNQGISEVHCHFDKPHPPLLPGMYMNAEVDTQTVLTEALPEESVVYYEGRYFVFIEVKKLTYQLFPVKTGAKEDGFIQIENASELKDKAIVTKGAYTLLMKLKNTEDEE